jgi:hypothetical protein
MADEVELHFNVDGKPEQALAAWKSDPPAALRIKDFQLVDESFNSLTYEARYYDWPQKVLMVTTLGFAAIFKGFMVSLFRFTVRFDPEGGFKSRATLVGKADPATRAALGEMVAERGGSVGLRVGA